MKIFPANWWAGMKYSHLQIMIYEKEVSQYQVFLKSDGAKITSVQRTGNPNYLLIYIETKEAPIQTMYINLTAVNRKTISIPFELKERTFINVPTIDSTDVVYLLIPDRWAEGKNMAEKENIYKKMKEKTANREEGLSRHGGDIAGMVEHLNYLEELGITSIWPTCMLENDNEIASYHGYGVTDHYKIDPRLGSNDEFKEYVKKANQRGIKVIMDLVFNQCSNLCFLYDDMIDPSWFNMNKTFINTNFKTQNVIDPYSSIVDHELATRGWFDSKMPSLAGDNPQVAQYLYQSSLWWIEYAGINGIRMDTYPYNDWDFMQQWCKTIEEEHPGFNIIGETWLDSNVGISIWQKDSPLAAPRNSMLPSVMDFPLFALFPSVCDEETDDWTHGLTRIVNYLYQDYVYAHPRRLLTFISNHDTCRFSNNMEQIRNTVRYKQALTLLLTLRGIPQLYYGDEIAMYGTKDNMDIGQRHDFPGGFEGDNVNVFLNYNMTDYMHEYLTFTRKILNWRKRKDINSTIAFGKTVQFNARYGVYVYARILGDTMLTFMINGTWKDVDLPLNIFHEVLPKNQAYEMLSDRFLDFSKDTLHFNPRDIFILEWR